MSAWRSTRPGRRWSPARSGPAAYDPIIPADVPQAAEHAVREKQERVEVRILIGAQGDGENAYVVFHPEPGRPLFISPDQWIHADANDHKVAWQIKESIAARHRLADLSANVDVLFDRLVPTSERPEAHMVRAILVESTDTNAMGRAVWTIDLQRHGHGGRPFHPGDLVIRTPGFQGFFEIVDVELEHRSPSRIGLVVKPAPDLAFDLTPE